MLTISLVLRNGEHVEMEVQQFEIVRTCHYHRCRIKFKTVDPDQMYCPGKSCRVQASKHRCALRELGHILTR